MDPHACTTRNIAGGRIKLRGRSDNLPQQWWFASTAIPLLVATLGPLSHVLSLASLISTWRVTLPDNGAGADNLGVGIPDPKWELILNGLSLICGFTGNFFLLLHFRTMRVYEAPIAPAQVWSQGYWHAILASLVYFAGSMGLFINMIGYFRGHYPQQFDLDDDQRTLIQQSMMFFFWLAGCSAVFSALEGLSYPDALYYADVSILTIGFGDIAPKTESGRGFLFVFQLVGIIFLGLVISSISRFAANISADKIIKQHQKHARESTVGRTVTSEMELRERLGLPPPRLTSNAAPANANDERLKEATSVGAANGQRRGSLAPYGRIEIVGRTVTFHENKEKRKQRNRQKLLLLQEEKDRFDAMRQIQDETRRWKQYWALAMAFLAFGILWCFGAFIFMLTEARISHLGYFDALYFCFVALLTIGYGDVVPKSNIGKPFFIVWSLIAVPIVTFLITELSKTVVAAVSRGTGKLADWTMLLDQLPALRNSLTRLSKKRQKHKRIAHGFQVQNPDEPVINTDIAIPDPNNTNTSQDEAEETHHDLARQLATAIKSVAHDLRSSTPKQYTYQEWHHFTKLIRFSHLTPEGNSSGGGIEWDWIGEDSPLLADITEAEWVLDRLCESLHRYLCAARGGAAAVVNHRGEQEDEQITGVI
ncbi:hypothetical protein B0H66DRAFT_623855 [Apodospora peruviana]|uniref:Potassium channel domain-containing protein n=1 Tax=Apodospora peruviana TaxID=516989 RepID=A0AAE0I652_9PEZI|nr:hypothetical protein B0H66DRAFT_623855 [Apodospora peruviana]